LFKCVGSDGALISFHFHFAALLFDCVDALPLCDASIPLDVAAFNAVASCRSDGCLIANSGSNLIDVSIYFDKDSSIIKTQAKQRL
jgi:hypothetical protein